MKTQFRLICRNDRGGIFYSLDKLTGERVSLETTDRKEAQRLIDAKNYSLSQPALNLAMAKVYLTAGDPKFLERTWSVVMDEFCKNIKEVSRKRRERALRNPAFDCIRNKKIVETTADDFKAVLNTGGVFINQCLHCLQSLAIGMAWLPWPVIPAKLWPKTKATDRRGITEGEHRQIIEAEQNNTERRLYYELLWETGASQSDAAALTTENINWGERTVSYYRKKTGELAILTIGQRLEGLLKQLSAKGPLFPKISKMLDKDRSAEFHRRCRLLKIEGVSLHSYRYAFAERAKTYGYPERFAQAALGHGSKAVHRAYSRQGIVKAPSLEEFEKKTIPLPQAVNQ